MEKTYEHQFFPITSITSGWNYNVTQDLRMFTTQIVNVCLAGPFDDEWVLIDAGMPHSSADILYEAKKHFHGQPPKAILLTHGHFDHVGSIMELIRQWNVPVYAHKLELPYLTGEEDYPPPDPTVKGGLVAAMSRFFPNEAIYLNGIVKELPIDGSVPGMPDWQWIHTPGHTPGHVSFFREKDRALIAGDAFCTVEPESFFKVFTQIKDISGPPAYFTTDWDEAWESVRKLAALNPEYVITGHGKPVQGNWISQHLTDLAEKFDSLAIPEQGRYVH